MVARGGNGGNTMVVLSQLGDYALRFMGTLGMRGGSCEPIVKDLQKYGVDTELCVVHPDLVSPTSYITQPRSGSRTIITFRELPELSAADFERVPNELLVRSLSPKCFFLNKGNVFFWSRSFKIGSTWKGAMC